MTVIKTAKPPVIDGKFEPGKWDGAAACTAFVRVFDPKLAHLQTVVFVTYDDKYIYLCVKNSRGKDEKLLLAAGRRPDDENIVYDYANEIWFSPPTSPARTYQTMFNVYPGVLGELKIPSLGYSSKSWTGHWDIASSQNKDGWVIEARAPLSAFGFDNVQDGALWKALFATDILADPDGFRAWAPGGAFEDIGRHGTIRFRAAGPVFQFLDVETLFTGKPKLRFGVTGPLGGSAKVEVEARFGARIEPAAADLKLTRELTAVGGRHEEFSLEGDLSYLKLLVNEAGKRTGYCEITARAEGGLLYRQVFPFAIDGFVRERPTTILSSPYKTPFGISASYAPLDKKLLVKVDRYYMGNRQWMVSGEAKLIDPKNRQVVAERPIAPFSYDYSEFPIDLSEMKIPVQTERDRGVNPADYVMQVDLKGEDGKVLSTASVPVKLLGYQFEWLPNQIGISDKVIPPWTPMEWADGSLSMWNKTYRLNGLGLAESIINGGAPQLSGAMRLVATIDGREEAVLAGKPALSKWTEAAADLTGSARAGAVDIAVKTRVEFDGFVLNTMTLTPSAGATLDRLSLVVTMPKAEAPCLVTTSGGWSSYHGWTPEKWDSRETSSGSRRGNFVPYIFLTDSERGFCWFADNDQGWILDPALPTQELVSDGKTVTLKINFVTKPGKLEKPVSFRYGWMVTPQKPQPKSWRAYLFQFYKPYPKVTAVFFNDADRFALWSYFSSPFPNDYKKSKEMLDDDKAKQVFSFVGNVAHSIGRYQDYKGRIFNDLDADWGEIPGVVNDGRVARSRGPNDFQLWHFNRWIEKSGLTGLYFDENYLSEDTNYITGSAYLLPDQSIQPGYSYLGLREFDKRLRYMFHAHGIPPPNLFLHTTGGQAVYAWMPDISMEGENVEPNGNDYPDAYPASRMRAIGMGVNLGSAPLIMGQAQRHFNPVAGPFLVHQFVGWVLLHDAIPEGSKLWERLVGELEMWREEMRFIPYWKTGLGVESRDPEILASAHIARGQGVVWVFNIAHKDKQAAVKLDLAKLGFDARQTIAYDVETGRPVKLKDGEFDIGVPARLWRAIRIRQPRLLSENTTFVAGFKDEACADEALGNPLPRGATFPVVSGAGGKGLSLEEPVTFETRHHLEATHGSVTFQADLEPGANGNVLSIGDARFYLDGGRLHFNDAGSEASAPLPDGKHAVNFSWAAGAVSVLVDGRELLRAPLPGGMPIPPMDRGAEINDDYFTPAGITFGPIKGVMSDLTMTR